MFAAQGQDELGLTSEFKVLADDLAMLLQAAGLKTKAYHEGTPYFAALTVDKKMVVLEHLRFYRDLCAEQLQEGKSLRDSQTFTWRALKKCNLVPNANFLSQVTSGDIVEIYNESGIQLFRNLEFFELCSYTLEDLYCCEWWRLYRRSDRVINILMNCCSEIFANEHPQGVHYPVHKHELEEIASIDRNRICMDVKFVGPLYTKKSIKALICIEAARFLLPGERLDSEFQTI